MFTCLVPGRIALPCVESCQNFIQLMVQRPGNLRGFPKNRGTPKLMVYKFIMENPMKMG